jgi:hypothetical protein
MSEFKEQVKAMQNGHMYQVIDGRVVEVVRHEGDIVPKPETGQSVGQLALNLYEGDV